MEINAFHVNISKGSKQFPFFFSHQSTSYLLLGGYSFSKHVHTKALRNADDLITIAYFVNCNTNCNKEL